MTLKERFLYVVLWPIYHTKFRFVINCTDFDRERLDPYILIGNHASLHDALYTLIHLKNKYPYPVMNTFLITKKFMELILTKLIHTVSKRKGQSDVSAVKGMMHVIKDQKRGILLYPEGNASYFGKESDFPYSTVKFLKKMELDIVMCKVNGAYLAAPRWGIPVKKGFIELNFYTLYKGKELASASLDDIYEKIKKAIEFNDFDWNRVNKNKYDNRTKALGLEKYIYVCPHCNNHTCLSTKKNEVYCIHCGKIAEFNQYGLIEGLPFDNLVDWDEYQKQFLDQISRSIIKSKGKLNLVNLSNLRLLKLGNVDIILDNNCLHLESKHKNYDFKVEKITGLVLTKKQDLSFEYEAKTYYLPTRDPMILLDTINYLKGGY